MRFKMFVLPIAALVMAALAWQTPAWAPAHGKGPARDFTVDYLTALVNQDQQGDQVLSAKQVVDARAIIQSLNDLNGTITNQVLADLGKLKTMLDQTGLSTQRLQAVQVAGRLTLGDQHMPQNAAEVIDDFTEVVKHIINDHGGHWHQQ